MVLIILLQGGIYTFKQTPILKSIIIFVLPEQIMLSPHQVPEPQQIKVVSNEIIMIDQSHSNPRPHSNRNDALDQVSHRSMNSTVTEIRKKKMPASMIEFLRKRKQLRPRKQSKQSRSQEQSQKAQQIEFKNQSQIQLFHMEDQLGIRPEKTNPEESPQAKKSQKRKKKAAVQKQVKLVACPICLIENPVQKQVKCFGCLHLYCEECLVNYVKYKISMFEEVHCPEQDCKAIIDTELSFFKKLPKRERRLYRKINNFYLTQTDPSNKLCPKSECDGVINVRETAQTQKCPECKTKFCSQCFLEAHEGECQEYEVRFIEQNLHYRQCTRCKIIVERIQGCNHMTCKCKYEFCYMCGGKWRHDHICKSRGEDEGDGCDWGESTWDHFLFIIKLPLKFILITLFTTMWVVASFSAAPYNLFFFLYWIFLIIFGGPCQYIFEDDYTGNSRPCWQKLLLFLIFPILIVICIRRGVEIFTDRFEEECPIVSDGYRWIIQI